MEKIKAGEVLKGYKYYARDTDGTNTIFRSLPIFVGEDWELEKGKSGHVIRVTHDISMSEAKNSLREIDFSEEAQDPKTLQDLESESSTIVPVGKIVAAEATSQGAAVFKDFDGKFRPIGDLGKIVISSTKEPNSIFKLDDTVHVLSYSNVGEFGKSTEGIVKTIYKDGTILVKVNEGVEEVHKEDNVSFTPFSIKEAGFSQIRPAKEPKEGDWGFFYNQKPAKSFCYHKLYSMGDLKKVRMGVDYPFTTNGGTFYKYFSHTPPQLAVDIPNPFKEC